MATQTHEDFSRPQEVKSSGNRAFGWVFVVVFHEMAARLVASPKVSGDKQFSFCNTQHFRSTNLVRTP